jgi:hypothetical protein
MLKYIMTILRVKRCHDRRNESRQYFFHLSSISSYKLNRLTIIFVNSCGPHTNLIMNSFIHDENSKKDNEFYHFSL